MNLTQPTSGAARRCLAGAALVLTHAALGFLVRAGEPSRRPNFLFLLGEGQGWSTLSVPMDDRTPESRSDLFNTPNLNRIAVEGMRFASFYAPSPRCTPSRAAFLTGKSPAQLHMTFVGEGKADYGAGPESRVIPVSATTELPPDETTIAELLKRTGYMTAHFGKWHVGRRDPGRHGFDESTGPTSNGGPEITRNPNPKQAYASAELGMAFMERAVKAGRPFYLQIAQYAGRTVLDAKPETYAAVRQRLGNRDLPNLGAAAVAEDADITYGMLRRKLEELGVLANTYIIYTADHGTPGRNPPLNGGKGTIGDGGLRVPLLIRGPGIPPGTVARQRATGVDLFPTIADLAGADRSAISGLEGGSLAPILRSAGNGSVARPREEFVVHFPHYDKDSAGPASALYLGDLKLVRLYETGERRLYNLSNDPGERTNLARQAPQAVDDLDRRLTAYLRAVNAQMPSFRTNASPEYPIQQPKKGDEGQPAEGRSRSRGGVRMPTPAFRTEVPDHPVDVILGRPTGDAITLSALAYQDLEASVAYGTRPGAYSNETRRLSLAKGRPVHLLISPLQPDTRYFYQFRCRMSGQTNVLVQAESTFVTARKPGSSFTFTVQADPHLDYGTDPEIYRKSLLNALAAKPDFHMDLGDTFMTDKYTDYTQAAPQYLAQRYYFGLIGHSAPVFLTLGNHDGEQPSQGGGDRDSLAVWSNTMRKKYFPNPLPNDFYTGNSTPDSRAGLLQDYYGWEWGDGLFLVLDPFWYSLRQRSGGNWGRTLGAAQYRWLKSTLESSKSAFKFVFIHHLVGGETPEGRGGSEASRFFEWGGRELDGRDTFAERRPGWPAPIHDLLVKHGVSIVFHGHDHLYARQERDGVIYQLVPQPGHPRFDNIRSASEYGYKSGVIQGASGILRVTVSPRNTRVDYVRAYPESAAGPDRINGSVTHSYTILSPGKLTSSHQGTP